MGRIQRPYTFLALGDSYTLGEAVAEAERWPVQLVRELKTNGIEVADPHIIARTGWTTDELAAAIEQAGLLGTFDFVSLLIGVNNQYRGRSAVEYREQFAGLVHRAVGFAGGDPGRVLVLSIPDWGVTPFAAGRDAKQIALEIDAFNAVNRELAGAAGARYADVTPISREARSEPALLAHDGLHPSGAMYTEWVRLISPLVVRILEEVRE